MFARFLHLLGRQSRRSARSTPSQRRHPGRRRLECETLEARQLLSVSSEFPLLIRPAGDGQSQTANACAANGRSVAVWTEQGFGNNDIYAQVYDASGNEVGGQIRVTSSPKHDYLPAVAMDRSGNFVVVWMHDFSSTDSDLFAARFAADGTRRGNDIAIATFASRERDPSVAMDGTGAFVVSYSRLVSNKWDVVARMYAAGGSFVRELPVAVSTSHEEHSSSVAMTPDGQLMVAYQKDFGGGDSDIRLVRYQANGAIINEQAMDASTRRDQNPHVAVDNQGNAVVVYEVVAGSSTDIRARRVSNSGQLGLELIIAGSGVQEVSPAVALDPTNGRFVVAYAGASSGRWHVYVREVSATDKGATAVDLGSDRYAPAISIDGNHAYMVTYTRSANGTNSRQENYGRFGYLDAAFATQSLLPVGIVLPRPRGDWWLA